MRKFTQKVQKIIKLSETDRLRLALIFAAGFVCIILSEQINYKIISTLLHLLGSFLVIAVPLEILRERFFEKENIKSFVESVSQLFDQKIDDQLIKAREFGLDRIEESLSFEKLFKELKKDDTLWWLDTFCPGEIQWIKHFKNAIQSGVKIKMLIMDPNSSLCEMRAKELGEPFSTEDDDTELNFTKQLKGFLQTFFDLEKKSTGHLNIVLYNDLLGVPCYVVERNNQPIYTYSSMYLTKPTGLGFPHFRWNKTANKDDMCDILFSYVKEKYNRHCETGVE